MVRRQFVKVSGVLGVTLALILVPAAEAFAAMHCPKLTTAPSPGGTVGTVVLNDTATLAKGASPTGSLTFNLYNPSHPHCGGTPAFTQKVTVTGNGSYSTTNKAPAKVAGTWRWTVKYSGDARNMSRSSACGKENVKVTSVVPTGTCEGSGSISVLVSGKNVTAYVPKGNWSSQATDTGVDVVNVEGSSITNTQVPTGTDAINSCATNNLTGVVVCTANNNDVWVLKGTGLDKSVSPNPLTDGATGTISFSGGEVTTSGVSMDATDNEALIAESVGGVGGFQFLNLSTFKFQPPFATKDPGGEISEDPLIDPVHHLILSAAEDNNFELINDTTTTSPKFYERAISGVSGDLDSSAEDCSTGIAFAPAEFSSPSEVVLASLTHAKFTPGTPGSWTGPEKVQTLTGSVLNAGADGSAVAQGTHTGVVTGEFGGNTFTAVAMPTTAGAGAPSFTNWVTCAVGDTFSQGDDPHTVTAYQSPNGSDAIALLVNEGATEMVRVDLTKMLSPASVPVKAKVCKSGTLPSSVETFIPLP